jgi:hypothetical protein
MTDFQTGRGTNENCKYFDGCSAPVCPMDAGAAKTAWFAGEDVCRLHGVTEWVKQQRKIAKTGADETAGCFTLPMLERRYVIGKKITGIDPDGTEEEREEAEKNWLDRHPPIKPKSNEEREKLAARMRTCRAKPEGYSVLNRISKKPDPIGGKQGPEGKRVKSYGGAINTLLLKSGIEGK